MSVQLYTKPTTIYVTMYIMHEAKSTWYTSHDAIELATGSEEKSTGRNEWSLKIAI